MPSEDHYHFDVSFSPGISNSPYQLNLALEQKLHCSGPGRQTMLGGKNEMRESQWKPLVLEDISENHRKRIRKEKKAVML